MIKLIGFSTALLIAVFAISSGDTFAQGQADLITPDFDAPKAGHDPKHTPKITAPEKVVAGEWFDVTIEIGTDARHPSFVEHFVRWIELSIDDVEIARTYLHPVFSSPKVTYTIALKRSGTLKVREAPNHTSAWTATRAITVTAKAPSTKQ